MTKDDIISMAREAGGYEVDEVDPQCFIGMMAFDVEELERFAALVAAAEQERCIGIIRDQRGLDYVAQRTVDAIRSQS
jgi:hypothetical protein